MAGIEYFAFILLCDENGKGLPKYINHMHLGRAVFAGGHHSSFATLLGGLEMSFHGELFWETSSSSWFGHSCFTFRSAPKKWLIALRERMYLVHAWGPSALVRPCQASSYARLKGYPS